MSTLRFHLSDHSESSSHRIKCNDDESSLERIHTFNLKASDSNKASLLSAPGGGLIPNDDLPTKKFKNISSLLSMKVVASE